LLPYDRDLYLIGDHEGIINGLVQDLAGIGLDRVRGYFGTEVHDVWRQTHSHLQQIPSITLPEFIARQNGNGQVVLDVRSEGEWNAGHVPGSLNIPVAQLAEQVQQIPSGHEVLIHCQTGARAAIGASLLRAHGITDVTLFSGGFAEWRAAGLPVDSQASAR
jgi:hydroxyacylglutathione hydrolase